MRLFRREKSDSPSHAAAGMSMSFDGPTTALKYTQVVPTLDSALTPGTNVIWCASLVLAWRRLTSAIGAPIEVADAEALCRRLNSARDPGPDMPDDSFIAVAGKGQDAIRRIQDGLHHLFPHKTTPTFPHLADGWLAYAYLEARVPFPIPYFESEIPLEFVDSKGRSTPVTAFGFREGKHDPPEELLLQGTVWCFRNAPPGRDFAIDLCRGSMPTQIVVACLEPRETLEATWRDLERRMEAPGFPMFLPRDLLLVPNAFWQVTQELVELSSGRVISPPGFPRMNAVQEIRFRLDRSGVELQSSSKLMVVAGPNDLRINRPFLLYMKKRGAELPFFVMWVDNAELLHPWGPRGD